MTGRFTVVDVPQRSPEWFAARLGRLTGSRANDMLAMHKDGKTRGAGRRNLTTQLVLERVTGKSHESSYQSRAMEQGIEREADAVALYEALTGRIIQRSGFLAHLDFAAGCSLDGYLGDYERIIEVKSPIPATHLEYLRTGKVPKEYADQVLHNLWVSGAIACDWLSYNPDFPEPLQTKMVEIRREPIMILAYEKEVRVFLAEVADGVAEIQRMLMAAV